MSVPANQPAALEAPEESSRLPSLYLLGSGLAWLLVGLVLSLLASVKLHSPDLFPCAMASLGRLEAAARNALVLGSASQALLGIALWLLTTVGRTALPCFGTAIVGTVVWNVALTAGVLGILFGYSTGIPGLEIPGSMGVILLLGFLLVAGLGVVAFCSCRGNGYQPSQWFIFGGLLWFAWLYATSLVTGVFFPGRGVLTALSGGWFTNGVTWLWLAPLGLAVLYHFIPELTGRSVRAPELAPLAFWSLAVFGGWTAASGLVGGPIPAWLVSVSVVAGVLLLIPVVLASVNLHVGGSLRSPAARFAALAALSFTVAGLGLGATALRCSNAILHFTRFEVALRELFQLGFVGSAIFAGAYALVPRLAGRKLPNTGLTSLHFGLTVLGLALVVGADAVGGWKQGWALADAKTDLLAVQALLLPWLKLHTAGLALFLLGQLAFVGNVALLAVGLTVPVAKTLVAEVTGAPTPAAK